jgi:glycosyltransferase involved in cell wall biosynthesis
MAPCFGTIARIAKRNRHTRVICILDNVIPHEKRPGDNILTKYFIKAVDGAIAMSESVLTDLRKFNDIIPAALNPHPLFDNFGPPVSRELALGSLGIPPDSRVILFFGFIRAYKGLDLLLKAYTQERFRNRNLKLIIAGEFYEESAPYIKLISENGIDNEVFLFDRFINDDEVTIFFSAADLVVQPYRSATQSGVTQIAYHFGKPMVVTDVGGLKEIVPNGECGYVVPPDAGSIADAIDDFFSGGKQNFFINNVKVARSRFSWKKMCETILSVYSKCTSNDNKK